MIDLYRDLGYSNFLEKPGLFKSIPVQAQSNFSNGISQTVIHSGEASYKVSLVDGYLQSNNFVSGSAGWRIDADGNVEFDSGYFRGDITGAGGSFSGSLAVGTNGFHVDSEGNMWWGSASTYTLATIKISKDGLVNFTTGTFSGTLSAASGTLGTITSGTITGATIQTSTSGARCVMTTDNGYQFYYDSTFKGKIIADSTQGIIYDTNGSSHFFRSGGTEYAQINSSGLLLPNGKALIFTGSGRIIGYGGYFKIEGASGGIMDLQVEGNIYPNADNARNCGASDKRWAGGWFEDISVDDLTINSGGSITVGGHTGDDEEFEVATSFRKDGSNYQWRGRLLTFKKGILTNLGDESSWRTIS